MRLGPLLWGGGYVTVSHYPEEVVGKLCHDVVAISMRVHTFSLFHNFATTNLHRRGNVAATSYE